MNPPDTANVGPATLPTRDGVGASTVALPAGPWATALDFLTEHFPQVDRHVWQERFQAGLVLNELGESLPVDAPYRANRKLHYYRHLPHEPRIPFEAAVLFQDEHLLVADKPHFLPVTPGGRYVQETLLVRLKRQLGIDTLTPLHRLDRETAGLVLFSVNPQERDRYSALFRQHAIHKEYEAIAPWRPDLPMPTERHSRIVPGAHFMQMQEAQQEAQQEAPQEAPTVGAEDAQTHPRAHTQVALIEVQGHWARYRLRPHTGHKHQLRVHMAALGLPIAGDRIYPVLRPEAVAGAEPDYRDPLRLLARQLDFVCPVTGQPQRFVSQLSLPWPQG